VEAGFLQKCGSRFVNFFGHLTVERIAG